MKKSIVVYAIAILFIGCFLVLGQCKHMIAIVLFIFVEHSLYLCDIYLYYRVALSQYVIGRPDAGSNYQDGHAHATTVAWPVDESK